MSEQIKLTPAQIEFVRRTFPGFDESESTGELAGRAASSRYFTRIRHADSTSILVEWDSHDEDWERFLALADAGEVTSGLLPEVYASDSRHGLILEEDLGAVTLKKYCAMVKYERSYMIDTFRQVLDALHRWQQPVVAAHPVIAAREMDAATFRWESRYFSRFCVTDFCGCEALLDDSWDEERTALANECAALPQTAIHRDFQSENVLLHEGVIRFVDFQGARLGPPQYDVASLLFDPYVPALDRVTAYELYEYYGDLAGESGRSLRALQICAAQRLMQALGAYGNLTLHKGKEWYREYIPIALERLCGVLGQTDGFPRMLEVVRHCSEVVSGGNCMAPAG